MISVASAADVRNAATTYGLKGGFVSPGTWFVGDFEYDPDAGFTLGGFLDHKLGQKILGGGSLDFHRINAYETSGMLMDFGITIKALIYSETSNMTFRPWIGISYGSLGKMDIYASSQYMILKGGVEAVFSTSGGTSWLGEIGLWGAPDGGNDDFEAYFGTGIILRGGIVF